MHVKSKSALDGSEMSKDNKMKGLLKGLRYISNIFENEKEDDMQIGFPTDVKHVAHIGYEGQSVNNDPSWMNEFKGAPGNHSQPLKSVSGEIPQEGEVQWVSEDMSRKRNQDGPEVPKSSRNGENRRARRSSRPSKDGSSSRRVDGGEEASGSKATDAPKKARRKKCKDSKEAARETEGSSRSSRRTSRSNATKSCDTLPDDNDNEDLA